MNTHTGLSTTSAELAVAMQNRRVSNTVWVTLKINSSQARGGKTRTKYLARAWSLLCASLSLCCMSLKNLSAPSLLVVPYSYLVSPTRPRPPLVYLSSFTTRLKLPFFQPERRRRPSSRWTPGYSWLCGPERPPSATSRPSSPCAAPAPRWSSSPTTAPLSGSPRSSTTPCSQSARCTTTPDPTPTWEPPAESTSACPSSRSPTLETPTFSSPALRPKEHEGLESRMGGIGWLAFRL